MTELPEKNRFVFVKLAEARVLGSGKFSWNSSAAHAG